VPLTGVAVEKAHATGLSEIVAGRESSAFHGALLRQLRIEGFEDEESR
jgi:hypothetical protein